MQRPVVLLRLLVLSVLSGVAVVGVDSGQPIRVEVQRVLVCPYRSDDPDLATFKLKLSVRLTNRSQEPVLVPTSGTGDRDATRVALLGVQARDATRAWAHIVQSSWYDSGTVKYQACASLPPGAVAEFRNVSSGLVLMNAQLARLGSEPTVRFDLMILCRRQDGKVLSTSATTEEFKLPMHERRNGCPDTKIRRSKAGLTAVR